MTYSLICRQGTHETSTTNLEAMLAVRLMRQWAEANPQQEILLRDEAGDPVAYRRPDLGAAGTGGSQYRISRR